MLIQHERQGNFTQIEDSKLLINAADFRKPQYMTWWFYPRKQ